MSSHAFDEQGMTYCPFMPVFGAPQVMFERGSGTELWDTDGKRYLDFLCGLAVTSLGHANPVVTDAIATQAATLLHVSNFFTNPVATRAAVQVNGLLRQATGRDGQVFFCNSGAEANEALIKLARLHGVQKAGEEGKCYKIICAKNAFHGRTFGGMSATPQEKIQKGFRPLVPGFSPSSSPRIASSGNRAPMRRRISDSAP